MIFPKI